MGYATLRVPALLPSAAAPLDEDDLEGAEPARGQSTLSRSLFPASSLRFERSAQPRLSPPPGSAGSADEPASPPRSGHHCSAPPAAGAEASGPTALLPSREGSAVTGGEAQAEASRRSSAAQGPPAEPALPLVLRQSDVPAQPGTLVLEAAGGGPCEVQRVGARASSMAGGAAPSGGGPCRVASPAPADPGACGSSAGLRCSCVDSCGYLMLAADGAPLSAPCSVQTMSRTLMATRARRPAAPAPPAAPRGRASTAARSRGLAVGKRTAQTPPGLPRGFRPPPGAHRLAGCLPYLPVCCMPAQLGSKQQRIQASPTQLAAALPLLPRAARRKETLEAQIAQQMAQHPSTWSAAAVCDWCAGAERAGLPAGRGTCAAGLQGRPSGPGCWLPNWWRRLPCAAQAGVHWAGPVPQAVHPPLRHGRAAAAADAGAAQGGAASGRGAGPWQQGRRRDGWAGRRDG